MFTNTKRDSTQRNRQRLCGRIQQMSRKTPPQSLALQSSVEREEKEMYSPRSKYFPLQIPQSSMARTETLDRTLQQMHCLLSQSFLRWRGLHKPSTAYNL